MGQEQQRVSAFPARKIVHLSQRAGYGICLAGATDSDAVQLHPRALGAIAQQGGDFLWRGQIRARHQSAPRSSPAPDRYHPPRPRPASYPMSTAPIRLLTLPGTTNALQTDRITGHKRLLKRISIGNTRTWCQEENPGRAPNCLPASTAEALTPP
jgi:hypothetical protein